MNALPGWVGPTIALSLVVIAGAFLTMAFAALAIAKRAAAESRGLATEFAELRREIRPTIEALNRLAAAGDDVGGRVRDEAVALLDASRRLRRGLLHGARRVRGRLEDLDALYEVVHSEVEDTALDLAATLRSVRTGASALGRIKRLLFRGRR